jgi:predicted amidohydrolase
MVGGVSTGSGSGEVRIAAVQAGTDHSAAGNPGIECNLGRLLEVARAAAREGPDLIVFPEYSTIGWPYPPEAVVNGSAETIPGAGPLYGRYVDLARETGIHLLGWLVERDGERLFNTSFLLRGDGSFAGKYRKVQANLGEQTWWGWSQGSAFQVLDAGRFRFGVSICSDMWFPETVRCNDLLGAEVVIHQSIADDMQHVVPVRALDSAIPIVMCIFKGGSYAVDAQGQILAKAPSEVATSQTFALDLAAHEVAPKYGGWHPRAGLRNVRNPAAYAVLTDPSTRPPWTEVFCHPDGRPATEAELRQRFGPRYRER